MMITNSHGLYMSWITVIWSINAGASLTLAAFYGAVWSKQRENRVYLLFSCCAAAAVVVSAFELWMMHARTMEQYQPFRGFTYTAIVVAMAYQLSRGMARAARLTRELEVSDKRFNLAADSANLGMWDWNLEKDEVWVSPTRRRQLGCPASGRIVFEQLISRCHEDDRDKVRQAVNEAINVSTRRRTAMAWDSESCAIGRSVLAAGEKYTPAPAKGPPFIAVSRCKRSLRFL